MPRKPVVLSHWHQLYENFSTSSRDFYAAVEGAIKKRDVPDLTFKRVTWKESGVLSAKREYLRVARGRQHWDICAAPFGTGFFFSSRLAVFPSRLAGLLYLLIFSVAVYYVGRLFFKPQDFGQEVLPLPVQLWDMLLQDLPIAALLFLLLGALVRMRALGDEDAVLAMPILGFLYEKLFHPETYFKEDTDLMFKAAVEAAMHEAVAVATSGKSIRTVPSIPHSPSVGGEAGWGAQATG